MQRWAPAGAAAALLVAVVLGPSLTARAEEVPPVPRRAAVRGGAPAARKQEVEADEIGDRRRLGQRHASAHLDYEPPVGSVVAWFMSLTPKASSESTYFATNAHSRGYMGLQQVGHPGVWFQGQVVFSIWDSGCNALMNQADCPQDQRGRFLMCGDLARCDRFGNEGTGVRTRLRFDAWQVGRTYSFMVLAKPGGPGLVQYDGYFHAEELGGWVLLSQIVVPMAGGGWQLKNPHSFVEQWDGSSFEQERSGNFGPAYMQGDDGRWAQALTAALRYVPGKDEASDRLSARVADDGLQWWLGSGGAVVTSAFSGQEFYVNRSRGLPGPLAAFEQLRVAGGLPGGCPEKTCFGAQARGFFEDAFGSKTYSPITITLFLFVFCCIIPACVVFFRCRRARRRFLPTAGCPATAQPAAPPKPFVAARVIGAHKAAAAA